MQALEPLKGKATPERAQGNLLAITSRLSLRP